MKGKFSTKKNGQKGRKLRRLLWFFEAATVAHKRARADGNTLESKSVGKRYILAAGPFVKGAPSNSGFHGSARRNTRVFTSARASEGEKD